jgi:predicted acylesterase/phospholipase RssA
MPRKSLLLLGLLLVACAGPVRKPDAVAVRTCLVLSVGGVDGLAHLGAIQALQRQGRRIDCVYGNSMGAVVGSLYATAPSVDPVLRYREFLVAYEKRAQAEWDGKPLHQKVWAVLTGTTPKTMDLQRFEATLDDFFYGRGIEDATLPFATSFQVVQGAGLKLTRATHGSLAHAVAMSANNPMLFDKTTVKQGAELDPGADRVARVPVEDACATFPGAQLLVVNVTGEPAFYRPGLPCTVREVLIQPGESPSSALEGKGPAFETLVEAGRRAVTDL